MSGEKDLTALLASLNPRLNPGKFVFASVESTLGISREKTVFEFKEQEGVTVVLSQGQADDYGLHYEFVASWITLEVHSSLEAIGLTATFAGALTEAGISCNVVAGFYHDHIFVPSKDTMRAMEVLRGLKGAVLD
jgi:hypothetical protein